MVGTLIGQYRIAGIIGAGRMGTVYVGKHTLIDRRAAIKLLKPELSQDRARVKQFFHEARAAAAINNAGIVQIFDFGFAKDGRAYIVREFLEGLTLTARLHRDGALSVLDALRVLRPVASSMAAAHAAGLVHRDLKPDNIFLIPDAKADESPTKILDFGVAMLGPTFDVANPRPGVLIGTPWYMAPEQCNGCPADPRTDIYALGCVLFEALVGSPPFPGDDFRAVLRAHLEVPPPSPSSQNASISTEIDELVLRCLQKDPAARFPSMAELAGAIAAALERAELRRAADGGSTPRGAGESNPGGSGGSIPRGAGESNPGGSGGSIPRQHAPGKNQAGPAPILPPQARASIMSQDGALASGRAPAPAPAPPSAPASGSSISHEVERDDGDARDISGSSFDPWAMLLPREDDDPPSPDEFAKVFDAAIPPAFRDLLPYAVAFFRELFQRAEQRKDQLIQLRAPVIRDLASREHHVVFLSDVERDAAAPFGQIGTQAFQAQVDPLAKQLAQLAAPAGSVLITVLAAPQLGPGVRETIFALRKDRKLFIVPIAAAELRRACDTGNARTLLVNRIADLHTVSDPFAIFEGSTDPTCWVGFAAEVADLVKYIIAGGKIVSVAGPPGSGKTSMIAMAEYGCDTSNVSRQFVRIPCGDLPSHDPRRVVRELDAKVRRQPAARAGAPGAPDDRAPPGPPAAPPPAPSEPADLRATILELGAWSTSPAGTNPPPEHPEVGPAKRHQLVIVLEDADWLIRLASSAEPNAEQRQAARELWEGLAQLCSSGGHTVIVTSIRDFQVMDQVPLEQPIEVSRVPMRALNRRESDNLVTTLGEFVGFRPTHHAFAQLHDESGGNVYALRLLCSDIIRSTRERPDYSPLASLTATPRLVTAAVHRIAATGSSFRTHVSLWLDEVEKLVLQHVAQERPRSSREIRQALEPIATAVQVEKALDGLELMSLVEHRHGRHRVRIPLFERWIKTHLDAPQVRTSAVKQQRLSRIAVGLTCTALLFGGYWTWLRSTRSTQGKAVESCGYELDYPDRVGLDEPIDVFVYQDCKQAKPHQLAVEPVQSSLSVPVITSDCTATSTSCTTLFKFIAGTQAHDRYQVRLRVDGQPVMSAAIEKDRFAAIRSIGEKSVPAISFIPLVLALILSFYKEMKKFVVQLFGRGEAAPSAEPDEAPKI